MKEKLVSIIIPAYNCQNTIIETIESIEMQTYTNCEIIIINDGSTDETSKVLKNLSKKYSNLIIKNIKNAGVSNARNIGIELANGEYIMFADADDMYVKDTVSIMLEKITNNGVDMVSCGYQKKSDTDGKLVDKYIDKKIYDNIEAYIQDTQSAELFNVVWNKIYRNDIIKLHNITFHVNNDFGEDLCFNIDYIRNCKSAMNIPEILYIYKYGQNGLNYKFRKDIFSRKNYIYEYQANFYKERNYNLMYMYKEYIKNCYSTILKISNKNNNLSKNEKINCIEEIIKDCKTKNIINKDKCIKDKILIYNLYIGKRYLLAFGKIMNIFTKK